MDDDGPGPVAGTDTPPPISSPLTPPSSSTASLLDDLQRQADGPGYTRAGSPLNPQDTRDLTDMIARQESPGGIPELSSYDDSMGNRTVGNGLNLDRPGAAGRLASVGADLDGVYDGGQRLTEDQAQRLFSGDVSAAVQSARGLVPNYDTLPPAAQKVVADMVFNMGPGKFAEFKKMIGALQVRDFNRAADEMRNSAWSGQVGTRATELIRLMRSATPTPNSTPVTSPPPPAPDLGAAN